MTADTGAVSSRIQSTIVHHPEQEGSRVVRLKSSDHSPIKRMLEDHGHTLPSETVDKAMTRERVQKRVAEAVRGLDRQTVEKLSDITKVVPDARLVTLEVESTSFDIKSDGEFKGRANLLVRVPFEGFGGKRASTLASLAIPTYVQGSVSDSGVSVQQILIRD